MSGIAYETLGVPPDVRARAELRGVDPRAIVAFRRDYASIGRKEIAQSRAGLLRLLAVVVRLG